MLVNTEFIQKKQEIRNRDKGWGEEKKKTNERDLSPIIQTALLNVRRLKRSYQATLKSKDQIYGVCKGCTLIIQIHANIKYIEVEWLGHMVVVFLIF